MSGAQEFFFLFLILFSAYGLTAIGALFSESSGVIQISVEGNMVIGATVYMLLMSTGGADFLTQMGNWSSIIAMLIAGLAATIYSAALGFFAITLRGDQIVIGTALNILAPTIFIILTALVYETPGISEIVTLSNDEALGIAALVFSITLLIFAGSWFLLTKTTYGLRIRSAGQNPYALQASSVSVNLIRYSAVFITGFLSGMGGAALRMTGGTFHGTVYGAGFIAIGILVFGQWKTQGVFIGTVVMATLLALVDLAISGSLTEYSYWLNMIPFIIPIIILVFYKSSGAPKHVGVPFDKQER